MERTVQLRLKCFCVLSPQTMGENAPSQLILYHYPELQEDKGVVLMTAEMDPKFIVSLTCCSPLVLVWVWKTNRHSVLLTLGGFLFLPTDCPPGSVLSQSGAALLRSAKTGDLPVGGELQPPPCGLQTHVGHSRAGAKRHGAGGATWRSMRTLFTPAPLPLVCLFPVVDVVFLPSVSLTDL